MNTNSNENSNSSNADVEEVVIPADDASQEEKDAYIAKLQDQNKQLFARTKKAEGFELKDGKWVKPSIPATKKEEAQTTEKTSELSQTDLITLIKADVPEDDVPYVLKYAKMENISVAEALKSPIVRGILAEKAETRKTAEATNTEPARRGNAKVSEESLLENARKGKMPESEEDIKRLTRYQLGIK